MAPKAKITFPSHLAILQGHLGHPNAWGAFGAFSGSILNPIFLDEQFVKFSNSPCKNIAKAPCCLLTTVTWLQGCGKHNFEPPYFRMDYFGEIMYGDGRKTKHTFGQWNPNV
jgi:hypothetical protein